MLSGAWGREAAAGDRNAASWEQERVALGSKIASAGRRNIFAPAASWPEDESARRGRECGQDCWNAYEERPFGGVSLTWRDVCLGLAEG